MLEQKDFIDVEKKSIEELNFIKVQYENGKISKDMAVTRAQFELFNLQRKMKVLYLYLSADDFEKIKTIVADYESFIASIKSCENNL